MKFITQQFLQYPRAVLDIGSQNIVCLYGRRETGGVQVIGHSRVASRGIEAGSIVNMRLAKESISQAIHEVEEMADAKIAEVMGNLSFGRPASNWETETYQIGGETITAERMNELINKIKKRITNRDMMVMRVIPVEYLLDDISVGTPEGMKGFRLRATYHLITVNRGAFDNMTKALNECGLEFASLIPTAVAAARGVLVDEEIYTGVTMIDFGAETTSLGIFDKGVLVHTEQLQTGCSSATKAIAQCFHTPMAEAERIKRFHGSAVVDSSVLLAEEPTIEVPILDDSYPTRAAILKKSVLHQVTQVQLMEIVQELHKRVATPRFTRYQHHRLVLTGGGSRMAGMADLVSQVFQQPAVRKERINLLRPPPELLSPDNAVAVGLLNKFAHRSNPPAGSLPLSHFFRDLQNGLPKWRRKPTTESRSLVTP